MTRGRIVKTMLTMALVGCALSCLSAQTTPEASLVRRVEPLKPSQHISFVETGDDRVIHFFAENGKREEVLSVSHLREHMPQLTTDRRKAFFLVDDGNSSDGVDDLYYLNADKGEVRKFPQLTPVYAFTNDGGLLCYADYAYAQREAEKGNSKEVRMVLLSVDREKVVADFYTRGVFFIYKEGPWIEFDSSGSRFVFKVLQEDSHVAEYEMKVPSGATKLLSVSKDTFAAP